MQLLLLIMQDKKQMEQVLVHMMEAGIRGGTLVECEGALQALGRSGLKKPPVFGSLQQYLNPEDDGKNRMLLAALSEEDIQKTHQIVLEITGGLDRANTGVFLTLPLGLTDGLQEN